MISDFDEDGKLALGIHWSNWKEFSSRFGINEHRQRQLAGMRTAIQNLIDAGCKTVYVDGSFVTEKKFPKDYDALWSPDDVDVQILDLVFLDFDNGRMSQKIKYQGEFFLDSDIETNSKSTFLEFFQTDRETGSQKGIVGFHLEEFL